MWDLIELIIDAVADFDIVYHRDPADFAIGCGMKIGMVVLGVLAYLCWLGDIHFMAWFFGIPAVILLIVTLKHEWNCFRER